MDLISIFIIVLKLEFSSLELKKDTINVDYKCNVNKYNITNNSFFTVMNSLVRFFLFFITN